MDKLQVDIKPAFSQAAFPSPVSPESNSSPRPRRFGCRASSMSPCSRTERRPLSDPMN